MFRHILLTNNGAIAQGSIDMLIAMMAEAAVEITCLFVIPPETARPAAVPAVENTATDARLTLSRLQVDQWMKGARKAAAAANVRCSSYCIASDHPEQTVFAAAERYGCDAIAIAGNRDKGVTLVNLQV
jgi:hypothetical protein